MSATRTENDSLDYIDACRLAMEAGANNDSIVPLIAHILDQAPCAKEQSAESTRILVSAIQSLEATLTVP